MNLQDISTDMIAYLAAPYTAKTKAETDERIRKFSLADAYLIHNHQITTVSPLSKHLIFMHDPLSVVGSDWAYWENYSKILLKRSDVMLMLCMDGWDISKGVTGEINFALDNRIPIIFLNEDGTEKKL